jgi:hypothetical protein
MLLLPFYAAMTTRAGVVDDQPPALVAASQYHNLKETYIKNRM